MAKNFESSVPAEPRDGQNVAVMGVTDNENGGVVITVEPCQTCGASVEVGKYADMHEKYHAGQAESAPKSAR